MHARVPLGLMFAAAVVACSVDAVVFSSGSPAVEDCAALGDEDGNGLANCEDPACAEATVCAVECGNGRVDSGEQCDDGNAIIGDGCDSTCRASSVTYVKASNTGRGDSFGFSVALSADGSTLAVGAYGESSAAMGIDGDQSSNAAGTSGAVYVYVRDGSTWRQQAYIKASNTDIADYFGWSVALSADGSTLAVGALDESSAAMGINGDQSDNTASRAGAVYVFVRSGAMWSQQAYVKASNTGSGDRFGYSLALSGDGSTLAVGAYFEDSAATGIDGNQMSNDASQSGAVYVYVRNGMTWSQQAYVKASNTNGDDLFGSAVALSMDGSTLAVGAYGEDSAAVGINGNQDSNAAGLSGAVYVFVHTGVTWTQQVYVKASNTGADDRFGLAVALSGDGTTLAVGAYGEDSAAVGVNGNQDSNTAGSSGAAYVYVRSGATWQQEAYVKASNTGARDIFGYSLALSADGSALAVGAHLEASAATGINGDQTSDVATNSGAAYLYHRSGVTWSQQAYIKATNTRRGHEFSYSLALSADGSTMAAGSINEGSSATGINGNQADNTATNSGAVYVYR